MEGQVMRDHPAVKRLLATAGTTMVVFAETAVRQWVRVTMPDGRRVVVTLAK